MRNCTNPNCKQKNPQPIDAFYKKAKGGRIDGTTSRCIKCTNEQTDAWVAKNRDRKKIASDKWRFSNPESVKQNSRKWAKENPGKRNAQTMKRIAAKKQATPPWLTKEHYREIEAFYIESSRLTIETGIPHEVDHIVPLQGKAVRGLHVPWNLKVVTRTKNRQYSNRLVDKL